MMFGTSCSGAMLGAAPPAEADGVILFSGLASNPDIVSAGDYIFRTKISDVQVGMVVVHVLFVGVALGQIHRVVVEGSSGEAVGRSGAGPRAFRGSPAGQWPSRG